MFYLNHQSSYYMKDVVLSNESISSNFHLINFKLLMFKMFLTFTFGEMIQFDLKKIIVHTVWPKTTINYKFPLMWRFDKWITKETVDRRNPAPVEVGSLFHYFLFFYIPARFLAGCLPSTEGHWKTYRFLTWGQFGEVALLLWSLGLPKFVCCKQSLGQWCVYFQSSRLKDIRQIGSFPQLGVKIKHHWSVSFCFVI